MPLAFAVLMSAEAPFSFKTTPGRLPKTVVPRHYDIRLQPDIATLTFSGSVKTEIEFLTPSDRIVMNAAGLEIDSAAFDGNSVPFAIEAESDTMTLTLPSPAPAGLHSLTVSFRGTINEQADGLFVDRYPTASGEKSMLGTQFEVPHARRVFPCWDEPVFRATFDLTVVVPGEFMAVSNMPVAAEREVEGGLREVAFARTPSMSTYLLAFFAGEFETLEGEVDGVAVRIIATEGKRESAAYALESAKRVVAYMNDYFGVPYPLPKLDLIGVPNAFATFGAMENWGCISFIDSILLFDPETGSQRDRQNVFAIIAHEIAHQWFGNIVTMAWWDNLWLNEGFATWMGQKAAVALNPDWDFSTSDLNDREGAMRLDATASTHPVQVKIVDDREAIYSFDDISYEKGRVIIDMLESYVGEEAFRAGIRDYIATHKWSNTTTADLWAALDRSSGRRVSELAAGWTELPGFPVVHASLDAHGDTVVLRQERFEIGEWKSEAPLWRIPVSMKNTADPGSARVVLLDGESLGVPIPPGDGAVKLNVGHTSFYRTNYEGELAQRIATAAPRLPASDQAGLLADNWALVEAGITPATTLLELIEGLRESTQPVAWSRITVQLVAIDSLYEGRPGRDAFRKWAAAVLAPQLERVCWNGKEGEANTVLSLRSELIRALGTLGHEPTIAESRRRFADHVSGDTPIPAEIRSSVFSNVGRHADMETYQKLRELARSATSTIEMQRAYRAMQRAVDPALAEETLALSLTDEMPPSIRTWNPAAVASNEHAALAWRFVSGNFDALLASASKDAFFQLIPSVFEGFKDRERAEELLASVRERFPAGAMEPAMRTADSIRRRSSTRDRELPRIDAWIAAREP